MNAHVLAAGGLLERQTPDGLRIAVCRRTRYEDRDGNIGDWVLPKGKVEAGETLEETALREVEEETGCAARLTGTCFHSAYSVDGGPKEVSFFRMEFAKEVGEPDAIEIAEVVWLKPAEALEQLTYETERRVVRDAYPGAA
jgi:8-oxo-dGTP diphosphatase